VPGTGQIVGCIVSMREMASKIVDKIDPFQNKALIKSRKQKRSQGSSHYRSPGTSELQALPQLKGTVRMLTGSFFCQVCLKTARCHRLPQNAYSYESLIC